MVGGALLVLGFAQDGGRGRLAGAFFLFGLATWDKALAVWWLGAFGVAALAVFPRAFVQRLRPVNLMLALLAFAAGAAPLIVYNIKNPLATFAGNTRFSTEKLNEKVHVLKYTFEGSVLFGYVIAEEWDPAVREPQGALERASTSLRDRIGQRRRSWMGWGFTLALAAVPLWWQRRRAVVFSLIFLVVTWIQMAFTKDAGGGAHHAILLWPFPHLITASALAGLAAHLRYGKAVAAAIAALLCLSSLLVMNQALSQLARYGTTTVWTDAVFPLKDYLRPQRPRPMFAMDWGLFEVLRIFDRGQLPVSYAADAVDPPGNQAALKWLIEQQGLFLSHVDGKEVMAGVNERLRQGAARLGYRQVVLRRIADRNGRPVFEVSEFHPVP
jgi:hypothetical protein